MYYVFYVKRWKTLTGRCQITNTTPIRFHFLFSNTGFFFFAELEFLFSRANFISRSVLY